MRKRKRKRNLCAGRYARRNCFSILFIRLISFYVFYFYFSFSRRDEGCNTLIIFLNNQCILGTPLDKSIFADSMDSFTE